MFSQPTAFDGYRLVRHARGRVDFDEYPWLSGRVTTRNVPTGWAVSGYSLHGIYEFVLADAQQIGMLLRGSGVAM